MKKYIFLMFVSLPFSIVAMEEPETRQDKDNICHIEMLPNEMLILIFNHGISDCFFVSDELRSVLISNDLALAFNQVLNFWGNIQLVSKRFNSNVRLLLNNFSLGYLNYMNDESVSKLSLDDVRWLKSLTKAHEIAAMDFMVIAYRKIIEINRKRAYLNRPTLPSASYGKNKKLMRLLFRRDDDNDLAFLSPQKSKIYSNKIIKLLVGGADPNLRLKYIYKGGIYEASLLHIIIRVNQFCSLIRFLIFREIDINLTDFNGKTPLMISLRKGDYDLAKCLLNHRADPKICNKKGSTSIMVAIKFCKCFKRLLKSNLLIELLDRGVNINAKNINGVNALLLAVFGDESEEMVVFLIKYGAKLNELLGAGCRKKTALAWAVYFRKIRLVRLLLDNNADICCKDNEGKSVIKYAMDRVLEVPWDKDRRDIWKMFEEKDPKGIKLGCALC